MRKRIIIFFLILIVLVLIPILTFPRNSSIEDAQFKLAISLFKANQYTESITEFDRLLNEVKTKKYRDASHYYMGNAYFSLKQYSNAEKRFKKIVNSFRSSKYHSPSLYLLARSIYLQENFKEAINVFDSDVSKYPTLEYADNSLYWKAESLISMGNKAEAKEVLREVIVKYPLGNKTDAARFKLKLMELEEKLDHPVYSEETATRLEEALIDIDNLLVKEENYIDEIKKLNNQVDYLKTEINNLKEIGAGSLAETEKRIQEKIDALVSWENVLRLKEISLKQKELDLDEEFERIIKIKDLYQRDEPEVKEKSDGSDVPKIPDGDGSQS
jgi:TolA-binding protein